MHAPAFHATREAPSLSFIRQDSAESFAAPVGCVPDLERLDQQHLQQPFDDQLASRPPPRAVSSSTNCISGKTWLVANDDHVGRSEPERRIRRTETAIARSACAANPAARRHDRRGSVHRPSGLERLMTIRPVRRCSSLTRSRMAGTSIEASSRV